MGPVWSHGSRHALQTGCEERKGALRRLEERGPDADCGTEQALPRPRRNNSGETRGKRKRPSQEGKTPAEMQYLGAAGQSD